jgi:NADH:ubiquinone oxidoreductase subunit K
MNGALMAVLVFCASTAVGVAIALVWARRRNSGSANHDKTDRG